MGIDLEAFGPDTPPETKVETGTLVPAHTLTDQQLSEATPSEQLGGRALEDELADFDPKEINFDDPPAPAPPPPETAAPDAAAPAPAHAAAPAPQKQEEVPRDVQIARLRAVEAEAENKRLQSLVDQHGGEIGNLKRTLQQLSRAVQSPPADAGEDPGREELEPRPPRRSHAQVELPETNGQTAFLARQAWIQAGQAFASAHPEVYKTDEAGKIVLAANGQAQFDEEFVKTLQPSLDKLQELQQTPDPQYVLEESGRILETAFWKFIRNKARVTREALEARTVDEGARFRDGKQATAPTTTTTPVPPAKTYRSLSEVPTEHLDRFLDQHYGR